MMSFNEYEAKRNFTHTPEPDVHADSGKKGSAGVNAPDGALSFVVQKHHASSLHYDFRLELDGALMSWAVPKGPSLDPRDKRLAVHVEDHPLSYGGFEGTIPEGEYGAGNVIVWDHGTWQPLGDPHAGLAEGDLKFRLDGEKLHGVWVLVRMKPRKNERQESWLLIKERDDFACPRADFDILVERPESVISGTGVDDIHGVSITSANKLLFPSSDFTKLDLAEYYDTVGESMLPFMGERPLTLIRCPEGEESDCFYQRHPGFGIPQAIQSHTHVLGEGEAKEWLMIDSKEGIVALAQIGVVEVHAWLSNADDLTRPDQIVFDLDPGPGVAWSQLRSATLLIAEECRTLGLTPYLKSTGGKGLHVVVPIEPVWDFSRIRALARLFAEHIAGMHPDGFTSKMAKSERDGRVFIDYLRNSEGASAVAPYSTRNHPGPTCAVPLGWDELTDTLVTSDFTPSAVSARVAAHIDPWSDFFDNPVGTRVLHAAEETLAKQ